jgi:uncharacterized protein (DUF2062 family)
VGERKNLENVERSKGSSFANSFSNFWFAVQTGQYLKDTQTGYRLYPLKKLRGLSLLTSRYEAELELMVFASWHGVKLVSEPVNVYYPPREERVSHFRPLPDFTRISVLNTVLVLYAFLFYYPWTFLRSLTIANIKSFIDKQIIHSKDSNIRMAAAMGWGIFCGIIPIWGYQMLFAGFSAHFMKLNKIVAVVFSNISVPPMIPFLLYGSMVIGAFVLNIDNAFSFSTVSLDTIGLGLWQYCVGSIILAILAGLSVFVISLFIMLLCKRGVHNE